jgi:nucleoid-associated protein YgaU
VPATGSTGQDAAPPQDDPDRAATPSPDLDADAVVVRGGDSLWSIAAHHLPPDPSDADIDTAWRAWYSTNEQVIGDNPDLIKPGQLLLPPTTEEALP